MGKGAGTGVKRERRMERTSRFFVFDISLIVFLSNWVFEEITQQCVRKSNTYLNVIEPHIFVPINPRFGGVLGAFLSN